MNLTTFEGDVEIQRAGGGAGPEKLGTIDRTQAVAIGIRRRIIRF